MKPSLKAEISAIGPLGDGLIETNYRPLYVPGTTIGDQVIFKDNAQFMSLNTIASIEKGPNHTPPACIHFGECGGCSTQHLKPEHYQAWKQDLILKPLQWLEAEDTLRPILTTPAHSRRRTTLIAHYKEEAGLQFGYTMKRNHRLIDVKECPVLHPKLEALIEPLRALLTKIIPVRTILKIHLTHVDDSTDMLLISRLNLDLELREQLVAFAQQHDIHRISHKPSDKHPAEPIMQTKALTKTLGDISVEIDPGTFLQPNDQGEALMLKTIADAMPDNAKVADLFSGIGTLSLPLMEKMTSLQLCEANPRAINAMNNALGKVELPCEVTVEERNLFSNPLTVEELNELDVVIIDPPRAGARRQVNLIAQSEVKTLFMVSCNPSTFTRDVKGLLDAGFRFEFVQPIDQFIWTSHVEIIAKLTRE